MSDFSSSEGSEEMPTDNQLMTSWARISLDYGDTGIEVAQDDADREEPTDQLRREITDMIGVIRQAAQQNSGEIPSWENRERDAELTEEIFQKMLAESEENKNIPEAERDTEDSSARGEGPDTGEDGAQEFEYENLGENLSHQFLNPGLEKEILEASTEDVVQALLLTCIDRPEVIVYEAGENHVDLYVLTIEGTDDLTLTAHLNEEGKIQPGTELEEFAADLMEDLPVRGGLCATQDSYSYSAPVTALGEELVLDADAEVAALIELEPSAVPALVATSLTVGPVELAPADKGWSLISSDPISMVHLLQNLGKPAIVAESTEFTQHLAFVVPGGRQSNSDTSGKISEWMNQVVGQPIPEEIDTGAVINLVWGPPKKQTRYLPRESFAVDTLWFLPGVLPEPLNFVQINDEIENLTWFYGLDESGVKRLRNYVENSDSELGMESVLQLLGLPSELSKVAQGRADMESLPGYRSFAPKLVSAENTDASAFLAEAGESMTQISQILRQRPWIFTAEGVAQLSASGLLAFMAARRLYRGEPARLQAIFATVLAGSGISEIVLGRTIAKSEEAQPSDTSSSNGFPSVVEELDGKRQSLEKERRLSQVSRKLERLMQQTKRGSQSRIRKFFGER